MEELIIHSVKISRTGEIKHFEIPLSNNVDRITGVWFKVRLLDSAFGEGAVLVEYEPVSTYAREVIIGQLSLSSNCREGVFFYGNMILENSNAGMLDFTSAVFPVKPNSHSPFGKQLDVQINGKTATVHGFIQDAWGAISGRDVRYEVDIYLYQKLNDQKKKNDTGTGTGVH